MKNLSKFTVLLIFCFIIILKIIFHQTYNKVQTDSSLKNFQISKKKENPGTLKVSVNKHLHQHKYKDDEVHDDKKFIRLSPKEYETYIKKALLSAPKISSIEDLSEKQLHHTPDTLLDFSKHLATIKNHLLHHNINDEEEYINMALYFYKSCSLDEENLDSVRALCLSNLLHLQVRENISMNLEGHPRKIIKLSKNILDLEF